MKLVAYDKDPADHDVTIWLRTDGTLNIRDVDDVIHRYVPIEWLEREGYGDR